MNYMSKTQQEANTCKKNISNKWKTFCNSETLQKLGTAAAISFTCILLTTVMILPWILAISTAGSQSRSNESDIIISPRVLAIMLHTNTLARGF